MEALHGESWMEWDIVTTAPPRWQGHLQPNLPLEAPGFGTASREDDPEAFAHKIAAASAQGVDFFLFDWYWFLQAPLPSRLGYGRKPDACSKPFVNVSSKNLTGAPFLEGALERGFLHACNRHELAFALMWADVSWDDIHPAKAGWDDSLANIFPGYLGHQAAEWEKALSYVAETYMNEPNYFQMDTPQTGGGLKQCCLFSFYKLTVLAEGCGGESNALSVLRRFRSKVASTRCGCVHLSTMELATHRANACSRT